MTFKEKQVSLSNVEHYKNITARTSIILMIINKNSI